MQDPLPYGLIIAAASGLFGAAFFMLIELQRRIRGTLQDIRDMWTWPFLMARCIVGVGAAGILYFFFESGLLEGSLWPDLSRLGFTQVGAPAALEGGKTAAPPPAGRIVPNLDFALLVVWSFLAGYSQTLVPNLLIATEGRQS